MRVFERWSLYQAVKKVEPLPVRAYLLELARPWKLVTFAGGMAWLIYVALNCGLADWDVGVSLLMGSLGYLCAPWSLRVIIHSLRVRPRLWVLRIAVALFLAWITVDAVYVAWHTAVGNPMLRRENLLIASGMYLMAGAGWFYAGTLRELFSDLRAMLRPVL